MGTSQGTHLCTQTFSRWICRLGFPTILPVAPMRPKYSRWERFSDGVVHVLGVGLAVVAVPALIRVTAATGGDSALIGTAIYGITLVSMLCFSALYNMTVNTWWRRFFRRLDHAGIFVKIAGTYTPFVLMTGSPAPGFLAGLWAAAAFGAALKMYAPDQFRWPALILYLAMGWSAVWSGGAILFQLPSLVLALAIGGGAAYMIGVCFFLQDRRLFHNTIWHVFVLVGSMLFFMSISVYVVEAPTA